MRRNQRWKASCWTEEHERLVVEVVHLHYWGSQVLKLEWCFPAWGKNICTIEVIFISSRYHCQEDLGSSHQGITVLMDKSCQRSSKTPTEDGSIQILSSNQEWTTRIRMDALWLNQVRHCVKETISAVTTTQTTFDVAIRNSKSKKTETSCFTALVVATKQYGPPTRVNMEERPTISACRKTTT
jgi:hypothetical protein